MSHYAQHKLTRTARPAYRTLQGWALGVLVEQQAITECVDASYLAPPAQIRTGPIRAYGSHLGCLTAKRLAGHG
jgi:hypothetical protein